MHGIFSWLPKLNNTLMLRLLELFRTRKALPAVDAGILPAVPAPGPGYIEDQHRYSTVKYGQSDLGRAGCEVIAVYNALCCLHGSSPCTLQELITRFEQDGMLLRGHFGTSPKALAEFFRARGCAVTLSTRPTEFDALAEGAGALILTFYNNVLDIREEIHTVCISPEPGGYLAHNLSCDGRSAAVYPTVNALIAAINGGRTKAISLIAITEPR